MLIALKVFILKKQTASMQLNNIYHCYFLQLYYYFMQYY